MKRRQWVWGALLLALLGLIIILALSRFGPESSAQAWQPLSTPTMHPVDDILYQIETVGGNMEPLVFPGSKVEDIIFGDTTIESELPKKLRFWLRIDHGTGKPRQVSLVLRFANGVNQSKLMAQYEQEKGGWLASWPNLSDQVPFWTPFEFAWCLDDADGNQICTEYQRTLYWDPVQTWFRVETNHAILYWYGFGTDHPIDIARWFARTVATVYPSWVAGFGQDISYKPVVVIYPDYDAVSSRYYSISADDLALTSAFFGVTSVVLTPSDDYVTCTYFRLPYERTNKWDMDFSASGIRYGLTLLFAADVLGDPDGCRTQNDSTCVNNGPLFWSEGQALWLASVPWNYDQGLRDWAVTATVPDLVSPVFTAVESDGCVNEIANLGASFVNWLVANYGIDTHRQIVESMRYRDDGTPGNDFEDAIQHVTGLSVTELENDWRAYLELSPKE